MEGENKKKINRKDSHLGIRETKMGSGGGTQWLRQPWSCSDT